LHTAAAATAASAAQAPTSGSFVEVKCFAVHTVLPDTRSMHGVHCHTPLHTHVSMLCARISCSFGSIGWPPTQGLGQALTCVSCAELSNTTCPQLHAALYNCCATITNKLTRNLVIFAEVLPVFEVQNLPSSQAWFSLMLAAKHCPLLGLQRPSVHWLSKTEQSLGMTMSQALLASLHCSVSQGLVELQMRGLHKQGHTDKHDSAAQAEKD
jgi:hypothetical protein